MSYVRWMLACAAMAVAGILVSRCLPAPDGCTPLATRCSGHAAEICDGEQRWGVSVDCDQTAAQSGGSWVCCPGNDDAGVGATCLPAGECPQGGNP